MKFCQFANFCYIFSTLGEKSVSLAIANYMWEAHSFKEINDLECFPHFLKITFCLQFDTRIPALVTRTEQTERSYENYQENC